MSKIAHYLQEHLMGEVTTSAEARRYFSTDGGVFTVTPAIIVYPRNENDVRKTARFAWQLAERGRIIPIWSHPAHLGPVRGFDPVSGGVRRRTVAARPNYSRTRITLDNPRPSCHRRIPVVAYFAEVNLCI